MSVVLRLRKPGLLHGGCSAVNVGERLGDEVRKGRPSRSRGGGGQGTLPPLPRALALPWERIGIRDKL